jgi:hypothetical protein
MKKQKMEHGQDYPPPSDLTASSAELWRELVPRRARSPERLAALHEALRCRDLLGTLRAELATKPLTVQNAVTKVPRVDPALKAYLDALQRFSRLWESLNLTWSSDLDSQIIGDYEIPT